MISLRMIHSFQESKLLILQRTCTVRKQFSAKRTYENYNCASKYYDNHRTATGSDVIVGMIQLYTKKPLKVLHQLDVGDPDCLESIKTIKKAKRIMVSDGLLLVSTVLKSTTENSIWFNQLNKKLTERFVKAAVHSLEQYEKIFTSAGFEIIQKFNILGSDIYKSYDNYEGPLNEDWRKNSSYWSFATEEEKNEVINKVKQLKIEGELEKWARNHDNSHTFGL